MNEWPDKQPDPESGNEIREGYGKNVEVSAIFMRHGEKALSEETGETGLTEKGQEMSKDFGRKLIKKDAIKPYSSGTDRTIESVESAVNSSPTNHRLKLRIRDDLGIGYNPKAPFFKNLFTQIRPGILGANFSMLSSAEQDELLQKYQTLQHDSYLAHRQRPDEGTQAPLELAAGIARRVKTYIKMADRINSGSKVDLLNGTHDLVIAAFLKEVIIRTVDGKEVKGFSSVKEIGGPIGYNESFTVRILTDEHGEKEVVLLFRDQEFKIDMERLTELSATEKPKNIK